MSDSLLDEAFARLEVTAREVDPHHTNYENCNGILNHVNTIALDPDIEERVKELIEKTESPKQQDKNNNVQGSLSETAVTSSKRRSESDPSPCSSPQTKRRKSVTFADYEGGILVQVREYDNTVDLVEGLSDLSQVKSNSESPESNFILLFPQPCVNYETFRRKLLMQKVSLENARITQNDVILGTIKVQNIAFEKNVAVRITKDSWKTFEEVPASYVHSENDYVDVFTFRIPISHDARRVKFCVRFRCSGQEYWDNNDSMNYCVMARQHPDDTTAGKNMFL